MAVAAVVLVVTAGFAINYFFLTSPNDGVRGPGCTWGDSHCDVTDYERNCEDADVFSPEYRRYCLPIIERGAPGQPPWNEATGP